MLSSGAERLRPRFVTRATSIGLIVLGACAERSSFIDHDASVTDDTSVAQDGATTDTRVDALVITDAVVDARATDSAAPADARDANAIDSAPADATTADTTPTDTSSPIDGSSDATPASDTPTSPLDAAGVVRFQVSNLGSSVCSTTSGALEIPAGATETLDFIAGVTCHENVVQPGGPTICVRCYDSVSIAGRLVASTRPPPGPPMSRTFPAFAIVSLGPMVIDGEIDFGGKLNHDGPGAVVTGTGVMAGDPIMSNRRNGTGGGSHASLGGSGGANFSGLAGTASGPAYGNVELTPLVGGSPGGTALYGILVPQFRGGGGGGALELVSFTSVTVGAGGTVNVGGGGGQLGVGGTGGGATGGGSGGGLLIEAPLVVIDGAIGAGGGGGGAGGSTEGSPPSANGSDATARGGGAGATWSTGTGAGGAGAGPYAAGNGAPATVDNYGGGGGGGGAGRIRLNGDNVMVRGTAVPMASTGSIAR